MALMDKAALPLIEDSTLAPGTSNDWRNEASGWSGTVTFKRSAKRGKLSCRVLDYRIATPQRPADRNYTITWCRDTDGTWKIA